MKVHQQTLISGLLDKIFHRERSWTDHLVDETTDHQQALFMLLPEGGFLPGWHPWRFAAEFHDGCGFCCSKRGSEIVSQCIVAWDQAGSEQAWCVVLELWDSFLTSHGKPIENVIGIRLPEPQGPPPLPWMVGMLLPSGVNVLPHQDYEKLSWHEVELCAAMVRYGQGVL